MDRSLSLALGQVQLLHRVGPRLAPGEALLGLQQPTHYQQLARQVVEGLAGGLLVRIGDHPDQQRMSLAMLLRGHPPRVRHPRPSPSSPAPLATPLDPPQLIFWVIANDLVMANDLDDLDGGRRRPRSRRRAASWSSSTSATQP